jgi:type VII secretion protein EccE
MSMRADGLDDALASPVSRHPGEVPTPAPPPPRRLKDAFRWIVPVRLWQLTAWEAALLAVAFTLGRATPAGAAAQALAVVVLLLTSVRIGGCCLSQWAVTLVCYRHRQRTAPRRTAATPLTALVPDLRLRQHVDRAGNCVGLAACGDGLTAVVRLAPAESPDPRTLLTVLRDVFASTTIPLAGVQLVVWTVSAPPQTDPAVNAAAAPLRVYWLALRYRPGQAPHAALARGGGETGAVRAAASAAIGLAVRLDEAGYSGTVLDRACLEQELMVALGAAASAAAESAADVRETWRTWSAAGVPQACYLPARSIDPAALLGTWVPWAEFSCVSYTLGRTARGHLRGEAVVRLGGGTTATRMPTPGSALGAHAVRATGRHHRYVVRTLPLAFDG